ncbi:MAG: ribosome silencing factor [Acidobacteria bacterium]|nr:ribosome silencing factor [Acidobacteriota bacterium]
MNKAQSTRAQTVPALPDEIIAAARAAYDKKATGVMALDLRKAQAFTDFFFICTGQNARQVKAIADAIEAALGSDGTKPAHVEGYDRADWILLDYFTFVVHVFMPELRRFYDLERLWGSAARLDIPDPAA